MIVVVEVLEDGHVVLLVDARIAALAERVHIHANVDVLAQQLLRVVVRVEGVHQHQWHVDIVGSIDVL